MHNLFSLQFAENKEVPKKKFYKATKSIELIPKQLDPTKPLSSKGSLSFKKNIISSGDVAAITSRNVDFSTEIWKAVDGIRYLQPF